MDREYLEKKVSDLEWFINYHQKKLEEARADLAFAKAQLDACGPKEEAA